MINKRTVCTFLFSLLIFTSVHAVVMNAPRKVYVLQTKYFDILYSSPSEPTAKFLAENADKLFEKAMNYLGTDQAFRIPVVISPDSEQLSISYSPIPYNRILLYEGVPNQNQATFENTLLSLFYHEVFLAVNESIKSPFLQFLNKIVRVDALQPVALVNLPFSFVEGSAYLDEADEELKTGRINDGYFLQILSQAKLEGEFPTWFQAAAVRDITPGRDLAKAAGAAFIAFLQQRWGFEKFAELWEECGKFHILLTPGIFYKVYQVQLEDIWKEFQDSVPLPDRLTQLFELENFSEKIFRNDNEARYDFIFASEYGLVWYDDIRHEVDIFDENNPLNTRQLLFLADSVNRMSLSKDGRYLSISFVENKKRKNLSCNLTLVFDLKDRTYVSDTYPLRDAGIVELADGSLGIAGINVKESYPVLQIYPVGKKKSAEVIFERAYNYNTVPFSPVYAGKGKVSFVMNQKNKRTLCQLDFYNGTEINWNIGNFQISNLKYLNSPVTKRNKGDVPEQMYVFQFVPENENAFTRMGIIELTADFYPTVVRAQSENFNGGIYSPTIQNNTLFFSSHKLYHDDLLSLPFEILPFENVDVYENTDLIERYEDGFSIPEQDYPIKKYNPFKYYASGTVYPFFGIVTADLDEGPKLWPGLGFTYTTQTDPFESTAMTFSGVYGFADLEYSTGNTKTIDEQLEQQRNIISSHKDFSFAGYIKNTSTPVDLSAAALFDLDKNGEYEFKWLAGTAWDIPLGLNFRTLRINLQFENEYSTSYYDDLQTETYPDKPFWTNLRNTYKTYQVSATANYTNMNQYGVSIFENRGITIGTKIFALWDNQKVENSQVTDISQINVGFNALFAIPRLTPFQMRNGWILSAPSTLYFEFMEKNGTALQTYAEILLLGREIQNGYPFLYLYFHRFGLKAGYDLCLNYDTNNVSLPDLRHITKFYNVFENTHLYDNFYIKFDLDFIPPIGRLSSTIFKTEAKFSYYPQQNGFKFSVNLDIVM